MISDDPPFKNYPPEVLRGDRAKSEQAAPASGEPEAAAPIEGGNLRVVDNMEASLGIPPGA